MQGPSASILSWLRPEQIHVAFAGAAWQLQATTAADWLGAIACDFDNLSGVFPGLIRDEEMDAMAELLRQPQPKDLLREIGCTVVQAAGGRDWWWTVNLTRTALGNWIYINGILVRQGVRSNSIGLPDWLDACYTLLWERGDDNHKTALDIQLNRPPVGVRPNKRQTQQMVADFQAD